jgi:hypothetical protein
LFFARLATLHRMLFDPIFDELSDAEIAWILRQSIAGSGRLPRDVDLYMAKISAEHLVDGRAAGLHVIRPQPERLRP